MNCFWGRRYGNVLLCRLDLSRGGHARKPPCPGFRDWVALCFTLDSLAEQLSDCNDMVEVWTLQVCNTYSTGVRSLPLFKEEEKLYLNDADHEGHASVHVDELFF